MELNNKLLWDRVIYTEAPFDWQSKQILGYFSKRENKLEYLETLSLRIRKSSQTGQRRGILYPTARSAI